MYIIHKKKSYVTGTDYDTEVRLGSQFTISVHRRNILNYSDPYQSMMYCYYYGHGTIPRYTRMAHQQNDYNCIMLHDACISDPTSKNARQQPQNCGVNSSELDIFFYRIRAMTQICLFFLLINSFFFPIDMSVFADTQIYYTGIVDLLTDVA